MDKRKKLKKKIILNWALSYFVVCLIPLMVFVCFSFASSSVLMENVAYSNSLFLDSLSKLVDNAFSQNSILAESLLLSREVTALNTDSGEELSSTDWYEATTAIRQGLSVNPSVSDAAVFSPSTGRYVSGSRWGSLRDFYQRDELNLMYDEETTMQILSKRLDRIEVFDASMVTYDGERVSRILVVRPLSFARSYSQGDYSLASRIDIYTVLPEEMDSFNSFLIIDNSTGEVKFDSSGTFSGTVVEELSKMNGVESRTFQSFIASSSPSVLNGMSYVVLSDRSVYYGMLRSLIFTAVALFLFSLLFSALFILLRLKKEWLSYEKAINVLGDDVDWSFDNKDEYAPFMDSNRKLRESKEVMGNVIESQTKSLKEYALQRLLSPQSQTPVSEEALKECGISFFSDCFAVLIITLSNDNNENDSEKITESLNDEKMNSVLFSSSHGLSYIVSFDLKALSSMRAEDYLERKMRNLLSSFPSILRAASSDISTGLNSLGKDYLEAINVLEYEAELSSRDYLSSSDVVGLIDKKGYEYLAEDELELQRAIEEGNELRSEEIINEVFDKNRQKGSSPRNMRYLLFSIMGTVIRTSNRLQKQYMWELPPIAINSIIQTQDISQSLDEVIEATTAIVREVVSIRSENINADDDTFVLYKKALKIVQEEYNSSLFNVSSLALELKISNVHLSKVFKRWHGSNISDYIAEYRISVAKKLLSEGKEIRDIVDECGFGSLRTFLRLFKKYENITPSQYKAMRKEKNNEEV